MYPTKRCGAGAIFLNSNDEILIVKPSYRDGWQFVGGIIDKEETPSEACEREIAEEIGLKIKVGRLLCIDYGSGIDETVTFLFAGGVLPGEDIRRIELQESELLDYRFASEEEAKNLLRPKNVRRLVACLKAIRGNETLFLENGEEKQIIIDKNNA